MKKIIFLVLAMIMMSFTAVGAESGVTASQLNDGEYSIEVESSSDMFRITDCSLRVSGGEMTAVMTLGGTGYEKLYMGTGEEAESAAGSDYIYYEETPAGAYTYAVPVEALDTETDCAAWSIRKEKWYDRTLVFKSEGLPESAYKKSDGFVNPVTVALLCAAAVCAGIALALIKKRTNKQN